MVLLAAAVVLLAIPLSSLARNLTEAYPMDQTSAPEQTSKPHEFYSAAESAAPPETAQNVTLDASSLSLYAGDYVELRVTTENGGDWEPFVQGDAALCEKTGSPEDPRLRVTALSAGDAYVGVSIDGAVKTIPVQVMASPVHIDTASLSTQAGEIYGFVVQTDGTEPQLSVDSIAYVKQVEKTGLPENSWYYEITALAPGQARVCAQAGEYRAAFPVSIAESDILRKAQEYDSPTSWLVLADLSAQKTVVFRGQKGNWRIERAMNCSSGAPDTPTPTGIYHVQSRGSWFFNKSLGEGAQWYVGFWGDYLFHSFPMDSSRKVTDYRLGQPLSHGCIRLRTDEAKWLYDNLPYHTTVVIY